MDFEELFAKFVEENRDKLGVVAECPKCGGLVGYDFLLKKYDCMDCNNFQTDSLEGLKHWRVDEN